MEKEDYLLIKEKRNLGGVFFITPEDNPDVEIALKALATKYYSFNTMEFLRNGSVRGSRDSENTFDIFNGIDGTTNGEEFSDTIYLQPLKDIVERYRPII